MATEDHKEHMLRIDEEELRIDLALLQAAAVIASTTDLKPNDVPALARLVRQLWEEIHMGGI